MSPTFAVLFFAIVASAAAYSDDNTRIIPPSERSLGISGCGRHGKWSGCASKCPPKCSTRAFQSHIYCIDECVEGCRCNPGYILDDDSLLCIRPNRCKSAEAYIKDRKQPKQETPSSTCIGYCT